MTDIRRADERFHTAHEGVRTSHCFSAGAHYDPGNVAFGPVVACDEHLLAPGAEFARHPHARVELVTWVLDGTLRHAGAGGRRDITAGQAQYQLAGRGIEHAEGNASASAPLRFVQLWLLADQDRTGYWVGAPPVRLAAGSFDVVRTDADIEPAQYVHLFVASGSFIVAGSACRPGDSVRLRDEAVRVTGRGELLVVSC